METLISVLVIMFCVIHIIRYCLIDLPHIPTQIEKDLYHLLQDPNKSRQLMQCVDKLYQTNQPQQITYKGRTFTISKVDTIYD